MKRIFKGLVVTIIAAMLLLLLSSCQGKTEQTEKASLRLKWLVGSTYLGDIVAKEKGFWKEQNLEVTVNPGAFESDPIKLVANGSDTFGITGADQLIMARAKGIPVVAIAAILQQSPVGWVSKKSSGIKTPNDFKGKKVGTQLGTNTETTLKALMGKLNIDMKSFEVVPVGYDLVPFLSDKVDAYPLFMNDETVAIRNKGIEINIIDPNNYGINLYGNVYFTTERVIKEKPEMVVKFLKGMIKGWQWAAGNPEDAVKIMSKVDNKINIKNEVEVLMLTLPLLKPHGVKDWKIGMMDDNRWQETKDILMKYGDLKQDVPLSAAYNKIFVTKAHGE